jgi:threonine synthase
MFKLVSTRDINENVSFKQAVINGLSKNKGLYAPVNIEQNKINVSDLQGLTYHQMAKCAFRRFTDDFNDEEIDKCITNAYTGSFRTDEVVEISKYSNVHLLELYHGPTSAFKDVALQLLPQLLSTSLEYVDEKVMILTATSGDTGKAALEGFKDIANIAINVFYPYNKVSAIQDLQMRTTTGDNTFVTSVNTDFDGCQRLCKQIFNNKEFNDELLKKNYILSSANSINIGRLTPQVVYYFYTYIKLVERNEIKMNEKVNFVVPTGNFGNVLAGYYAKLIGLPVNKLIVASNENNILYDFITTGVYDANRPLTQTISPSMDILISSNVERLLFELYDHDSEEVCKLMEELETTHKYQISKKALAKLQAVFVPGFATDEESKTEIKKVFLRENKVVDPHTACGFKVYDDYVRDTKDETCSIILQTASCYKFSKDVYQALTGEEIIDEFKAMNDIYNICKEEIPANLKNIDKLPIKHNSNIDTIDALDHIRGII